MAVNLTLHNESRQRLPATWLNKQLRRVTNELGVTRGNWTVLIVHDARMSALHRQTLGIRGTTDVLTFNLSDQPDKSNGPAIELDTVLCVDEARRRSKDMGHPLREELLLYALHSLLHVRGYDDVTPAQAARIHRREDAILLRLGVGAVYAGKRKNAAPKSVHSTPRHRTGARRTRKKAS